MSYVRHAMTKIISAGCLPLDSARRTFQDGIISISSCFSGVGAEGVAAHSIAEISNAAVRELTG
eukprot:2182549-Alexandrium_andersonii.AAC.1